MNSDILPSQITHGPLTATHDYFHKERNYGKLSSKLNITLYSNTNSTLVYQHMHSSNSLVTLWIFSGLRSPQSTHTMDSCFQ